MQADPPPQRASLPVVEQISAPIGAIAQRKILRLAARLRADEPALCDTEAFGPGVTSGMGDGPALVYEDHGEIPLVPASDFSVLQYRALFLARDGDVLALGGPRSPAFETYCREHLKLGRVEVLTPAIQSAGRRSLMPQRCLSDREVFDRVCAKASDHGGLTLLPYLGTGGAWALAAAIARRTRTPVHVAAPPPRLTRRVNDKLWFAHQVTNLLGPRSLPPTFSAFGPAALTGRVAALARRYERIAIKLPDSAGSAGNLALESSAIRRLKVNGLRGRLLDLLRGLGWADTYPLMVEVWDCPVVASPSVQIWIPHPEDGAPIIEGIFEQVTEGAKGEFVGAIPATLSGRWRDRFAEEASMLARLFQVLGYFGRCSLDSVLAGSSLDTAELHWIQCNGRWGGLSIPMTLANRLVGTWMKLPVAVVQRTEVKGKRGALEGALARLGKRLYRPGASGGVVLLSPGGIEHGNAVTLMAMAETIQVAQGEAVAATDILLGRDYLTPPAETSRA